MLNHPKLRVAQKVLFGLLIAGLALPVIAEDEGRKSKLEVHGFLTQAWIQGDFLKGRFPNPDGTPAGPTGGELSLGISEDGTFDYRNMAIQFRYAISDKDIMIVQLSSRSLGDSPITKAEDEVELDWAFYERRFGPNTSVKVGRVQIPNGIFNEIRDVGVILPFFRPSFVLYQEGAFTSETLDGIDLSHSFAAESDWRLDTDIYLGQWDLVELDFANTATTAKAKDSYGAQLWLNTPVAGLRFGAAYQHRNIFEGAPGFRPPGKATKFDDLLFSVDAAFEKWVFRGEYRDTSAAKSSLPSLGATDFEFDAQAWYIQIGWHITPEIRIYVQGEVNDQGSNTRVYTRPEQRRIREDKGVVFNYAFSPSIVFKAEYHEVDETETGYIPSFGPNGFQLTPIYADLTGGNYSIVSLSVSF